MLYFWAIVFLIVYTYIYFSDSKRVIDKMFPGPIRLPFFGSVLPLITTPSGLYQTYLNLPKYYNYKTFRAWLLHKPYVVVTDYKTAKLILFSPSCIDKSDDYKLFDPWLGEQSLLKAPEDEWRKRRKLISPAFRFQILKEYFPVFDANSRVLNEKLDEHDGKESFDVSQYIHLYSLDNICAATMQVNFNTQSDPGCEYVKALKNILTVLYYRGLLLWLRPDTIFKMSSLGHLQEKCLSIIHGYSNKVIQEKKRQLQQSKDCENQEVDCVKQNKGFLDTIVENGSALEYGDREIREIVDHIIFAGHDTITSTLDFLFYALAKHQEIQEKVYQEVEKIFQKSDRCPTYEDLKEMKYMEQTIKETLRLYTTAPIIGRKTKEDFYINEKQYIPRNTNIAIILGAIHRDPEVWPNPDIFDPERFSPEASLNRDPYAFLAFSAGPKNCIGSKFAMFEVKITACRILRKFKLSLSGNPQDEIQIRPNVILYSTNGIRIKVENRHLDKNLIKSEY